MNRHTGPELYDLHGRLLAEYEGADAGSKSKAREAYLAACVKISESGTAEFQQLAGHDAAEAA